MSEHDFEILYRATPAHIRGNSNLPGHYVLPLTDLIHISNELDKELALVQATVPGYDPAHKHSEPCRATPCGFWCWNDYGFRDGWNLVEEYSNIYLQVSPSENMKRSNQTVQGFQGARPQEMEQIGTPNLAPRPSQNGTTVIIQNGQKVAQDAKKGWGLVRR